MEIIILFIIASVVGNIIKSAGQAQQTGPMRRGIPGQGGIPAQRGRSGQTGIPDKKIYKPSNQPASFDMSTMEEPTDNPEPDFQIEDSISEHESHREAASIPSIQFTQTAPPMNVEEEIQIEDTEDMYEHRLKFSRDDIINGIIMSEVLGPPLSRR